MAGQRYSGLRGPNAQFIGATETGGNVGTFSMDTGAFFASLQAAVAAIDVSTTAKLWTLGLRVQNNARLLCPVDTGRLRSSIQASRGTDTGGAFVDIGTNVSYAIHVEFGTRYMPAQPYLRPALAAAVGFSATALGGTG